MSSDGQVIPTNIEVVKRSKALKTMLEDCGIEDGDHEIVTLNIRSDVLRKVVAWIEQNPIETPEIDLSAKSEKIRTGQAFISFTQWETNFLNIPNPTLFELLTAANYLDIPELCHLAAKKIASMLNGRSPEEMRQIFNISEVIPQAVGPSPMEHHNLVQPAEASGANANKRSSEVENSDPKRPRRI